VPSTVRPTSVIHTVVPDRGKLATLVSGITASLIYLFPKGRKAELAALQRTVYPHKWSPVSCRSSTGQGKFAGQRPTFYHCHATNLFYNSGMLHVGMLNNVGKQQYWSHSCDMIYTDSSNITTTTTKTLSFSCLCISLFRDFLNKFKQPASILVWVYGGYLGCGSVLHRLGRLRCPLLDSVAGQNVDDADEIYLTAQTFCDTMIFTVHNSLSVLQVNLLPLVPLSLVGSLA